MAETIRWQLCAMPQIHNKEERLRLGAAFSEKWEQMADAGYKASAFASDQRKREPLHAFVMTYRQDVVDSWPSGACGSRPQQASLDSKHNSRSSQCRKLSRGSPRPALPYT
jgi:hypothetical protein